MNTSYGFAETRQATLQGEDEYAQEAACNKAAMAAEQASLCPQGERKNFSSEFNSSPKKLTEKSTLEENEKFHCSLTVKWECEEWKSI